MSHQQQSEHCFTIGHSNHPVDRFIEILHRNGIGIVVDVRSTLEEL